MAYQADLAELEARVDQLQREVEGIEVENSIYDSYLERHAESMEDHNGQTARQRKLRMRNLPQTISIEQKLEVANHELEEMGKEGETEKAKSEKLIDTLRAFSEHADLRIAELKKDAYEFKRDIVVGAENARTGKTMAEKVVRYMEDRLRARDAQIEKLRLKNTTLRNQIAKAEAQLRQKEEMGDVLHYIDFHQLQIENKQYLQRIEERNAELLRLKMTTGRTFQSLNSNKKRLADVMDERERTSRELRNQNDTLDKLRIENDTVSGEIVSEKRSRKRMSQAQADTGAAPQILDYINQKKMFYELQEQLRNWERKMEIMRMATKSAKQQVRRTRAATAASSNPGYMNMSR
uniref:Cilia- and flagella-associated protein 263 n=1 Tax=Phaeomonas parva TaxID=124430 RepID=A0A7S1TXK9_9STRA|mmetsp:Transcript_2205/g.6654  ORF Transcript_2205/g.6654 Transcript_2205/m.6654 type:complete len:350 (+) Transcript_2205:104-1153(+)